MSKRLDPQIGAIENIELKEHQTSSQTTSQMEPPALELTSASKENEIGAIRQQNKRKSTDGQKMAISSTSTSTSTTYESLNNSILEAKIRQQLKHKKKKVNLFFLSLFV